MTDMTPYQMPVSAKGIVFENGSVWLRKNERGEWELPGGKIEEGEQPSDTVKRELKEELGFDVEVGRIVQAWMYIPQRSGDERRGVLVLSYRCVLVAKTGDFEVNGEAGVAEFGSFSFDEVKELKMPQFYKDALREAWEDV